MQRPKLRKILAYPVATRQGTMVSLEDPLRIADRPVLMAPSVHFLVNKMDGRRTLSDLQDVFESHFGQPIPQEKVKEVIRTLDAALFLETERFLEIFRRRTKIYGRLIERPPICAGQYYEAESGPLNQRLESLFSEHVEKIEQAGIKEQERPGAIIAPSTDFLMGGEVYASAYAKLLRTPCPELVIMLGTCHTTLKAPFAPTRKDYLTPFGRLPTHRDFVEALNAKAWGNLLDEEMSHLAEPSLEFQSIFLSHVYPEDRFKVVPILCGNSPDNPDEEGAFLRVLSDLMDQFGRGRVLIVVSADLARAGVRYGDEAPLSPDLLDDIESQDRSLLRRVLAGEGAELRLDLQKDKRRKKARGWTPVQALMSLVNNPEGELIRYEACVDDDRNQAVTLAAVSFP